MSPEGVFVPVCDRNAGGMTFGGRQDGADGYRFRGVVDEIRLYDRALRLDELRRRLHRPEHDHPDPKPIREWTFRDDVTMSPTRPGEVWQGVPARAVMTSSSG